MARFIFAFKMDHALDGSVGEYEMFEGDIEDAIKAATSEDFNYGHRGVKIYELDDPVFDTTAR